MIGIFTLGAVPGLNFARWKADVHVLSKIGLPVLWAILTPDTEPSGVTMTRITPLPVVFDFRAS